jgi:hypothetical protein
MMGIGIESSHFKRKDGDRNRILSFHNTASEGESISKKIRKDSQSDAAGQQRKEEKVPRATRPAR